MGPQPQTTPLLLVRSVLELLFILVLAELVGKTVILVNLQMVLAAAAAAVAEFMDLLVVLEVMEQVM
jgi:hypothetical protein